MKHVRRVLKNQNGDAALIISIALASGLILSGYAIQALSLSKVRQQSKAFNSESGFYAGELAATSGYYIEKNKTTPVTGQFPLLLQNSFNGVTTSSSGSGGTGGGSGNTSATNQSANANSNSGENKGKGKGDTVKAAVTSLTRTLSASAEAGTPVGVTRTLSADLGAKIVTSNYDGSNLYYSYANAGSRESYCGKLTLANQADIQTCLVSGGSPSACTDGSENSNRATFGGDPSILLAQLTRSLASRKLPNNLVDSTTPIRRSTDASGGGTKWTDHGNADPAQMKLLCNMLGYARYVSSTCEDDERSGRYPNGKCNYHSPENNTLQALNAATGKFSRVPAMPKFGQTFLSSLTCEGEYVCPVKETTVTAKVTILQNANKGRSTNCGYVVDRKGVGIFLGCNYEGAISRDITLTVNADPSACNELRIVTVAGTMGPVAAWPPAVGVFRDTTRPQDFPYMKLTKSGKSLSLVTNDDNETTDTNDHWNFDDYGFTLTLPAANYKFQGTSMACP